MLMADTNVIYYYNVNIDEISLCQVKHEFKTIYFEFLLHSLYIDSFNNLCLDFVKIGT